MCQCFLTHPLALYPYALNRFQISPEAQGISEPLNRIHTVDFTSPQQSCVLNFRTLRMDWGHSLLFPVFPSNFSVLRSIFFSTENFFFQY
jgi:hypothetical protein